MKTKITDLRKENGDYDIEVKDGQIRENHFGRVILVITVDDYSAGRKSIKALVLKEGRLGDGRPFKTVPREYTREEILEQFPTLLSGEITFDYKEG